MLYNEQQRESKNNQHMRKLEYFLLVVEFTNGKKHQNSKNSHSSGFVLSSGIGCILGADTSS